MVAVRKTRRGPSLAPPPEAIFLTLPQVCRRMQLSRPAVVKLIEGGRLAAIKAGRHWRISAESVEHLAKGGDQQAVR
jgi:excisionase family DNA binding protein